MADVTENFSRDGSERRSWHDRFKDKWPNITTLMHQSEVTLHPQVHVPPEYSDGSLDSIYINAGRKLPGWEGSNADTWTDPKSLDHEILDNVSSEGRSSTLKTPHKRSCKSICRDVCCAFFIFCIMFVTLGAIAISIYLSQMKQSNGIADHGHRHNHGGHIDSGITIEEETYLSKKFCNLMKILLTSVDFPVSTGLASCSATLLYVRNSDDVHIELHVSPKKGYTIKEKITRALRDEVLIDGIYRVDGSGLYLHTNGRILKKKKKIAQPFPDSSSSPLNNTFRLSPNDQNVLSAITKERPTELMRSQLPKVAASKERVNEELNSEGKATQGSDNIPKTVPPSESTVTTSGKVIERNLDTTKAKQSKTTKVMPEVTQRLPTSVRGPSTTRESGESSKAKGTSRIQNLTTIGTTGGPDTIPTTNGVAGDRLDLGITIPPELPTITNEHTTHIAHSTASIAHTTEHFHDQPLPDIVLENPSVTPLPAIFLEPVTIETVEINTVPVGTVDSQRSTGFTTQATPITGEGRFNAPMVATLFNPLGENAVVQAPDIQAEVRSPSSGRGSGGMAESLMAGGVMRFPLKTNSNFRFLLLNSRNDVPRRSSGGTKSVQSANNINRVTVVRPKVVSPKVKVTRTSATARQSFLSRTSSSSQPSWGSRIKMRRRRPTRAPRSYPNSQNIFLSTEPKKMLDVTTFG